MAKTAFISCDVATLNGRFGDAGTFVTQFAGLLKERGDEVSIIVTRGYKDAIAVDQLTRENYRSLGIELIELQNKDAAADRSSESWLVHRSEQLAPLLGAFDVVYFTDRANAAFHTVRKKRFTSDRMPVCVTVLHGPSQWARSCNQIYPRIPEDSNLDFVERYSALHSDFVVATSRYILDWAESNGWEFRHKPDVLGLPYRHKDGETRGQLAGKLERLVCYSPLDTRKGLTLLVNSLRTLSEQSSPTLHHLDEVVLLGREEKEGAVQWVRRELKPAGLRVTHLQTLDRTTARDYLVENARNALAVVPTPSDSLPYAVIEASLIPGLNLICSRGGGASEIFSNDGEKQLFDPLPFALSAKLGERLKSPLAPEELAKYEFEAANERWLAFHQRACEQNQEPRLRRPAARESKLHAIDVCVAYSNRARHFPQLLESLDRQTSSELRVIAVDHGPADGEARTIFKVMAAKYSSRGWSFLRHPGLSIHGARNLAAKCAQGEYLLMVDANDILAFHSLARMLEAARLSGIDCLVSGSCFFTGDDLPYDRATGELNAQLSGCFKPLGANLVAGLLEPAMFDGQATLIRRKVFEAMGGYQKACDGMQSNFEMHARLALAGYSFDVLPEYLVFRRQPEDGPTRASDEAVSRRRLIEIYDRHLAGIGLYGAAAAMSALYQSSQGLEKQALDLEGQLQFCNEKFQVLGFGEENQGLSLVGLARRVRRAYHQVVPDNLRRGLRFRKRLMKFIGRDEPQ